MIAILRLLNGGFTCFSRVGGGRYVGVRLAIGSEVDFCSTFLAQSPFYCAGGGSWTTMACGAGSTPAAQIALLSLRTAPLRADSIRKSGHPSLCHLSRSGSQAVQVYARFIESMVDHPRIDHRLGFRQKP